MEEVFQIMEDLDGKLRESFKNKEVIMRRLLYVSLVAYFTLSSFVEIYNWFNPLFFNFLGST
jgi:hypothetical protein